MPVCRAQFLKRKVGHGEIKPARMGTCLALLLLNQSGSHTHTRAHTRTRAGTYTYAYMHTHAYTHTHTCSYTHTCMHTHTHRLTHAHTYTRCSILTFCMDSSEYIRSSLVSSVDIVDCSSVNSEKLSLFTFVPCHQQCMVKVSDILYIAVCYGHCHFSCLWCVPSPSLLCYSQLAISWISVSLLHVHCL